jgi:hypothetical protein
VRRLLCWDFVGVLCLYFLSIAQARGAVTVSVSFDDPLNQLTTVAANVEQHVIAAGNWWGYYLDGNASIEVVVKTSTAVPYAEGRSFTSGLVTNNGAFDVFEQGVVAELRSGSDPNGTTADVEILLNPDYALNELWYDPDPMTRTATVDSNRTDAMSTFLHEFGHAIGFAGWIHPTLGTYPGDYQSTYDEHVQFDGDNFYFTGTAASIVNQGPVPLTYGNVSHVGNFAPRPGENLVLDVMNGLVFYRGTRYYVSTLDLAMLQDMGVLLVDRGGDFDFDGDVDGRDFLVWQRGGSPSGTTAGDLAEWQRDYGAGQLEATLHAVPEPGCLTVMSLVTFGISSLSRKWRLAA